MSICLPVIPPELTAEEAVIVAPRSSTFPNEMAGGKSSSSKKKKSKSKGKAEGKGTVVSS